jgi:hypothetical protein
VRPKIRNRNFAALPVSRKRPQPHILPETVRNTGMQLDRYFTASSLRLDDDRQGNPLAACVRCRYSMISKA